MATQGDYNNEAVDALSRMNGFQRALQLFTGTIANAGNTATFGGLGALGDLARGTPWGTTGGQLSAQVRAASPVADTASQVLGAVGSGKALFAAAPAVLGGARTLLTAAPALGTRAAALGATSTPFASTIARVAAPAAVALGLSGYLNNGEAAPAAVAAEPADPNVPTSGPNAGRRGGLRIGPDASGPVATVLSPARPRDPQSVLGDALTKVLGNNPTISDIAALGGLVPAAVKPTGTQRDMVFGQAYAQSKAIADASIASLAEQVQAGTITQAQAQAAAAKVLKDHFDQTAGLVGYDPSKVALPMPGEGDGS